MMRALSSVGVHIFQLAYIFFLLQFATCAFARLHLPSTQIMYANSVNGYGTPGAGAEMGHQLLPPVSHIPDASAVPGINVTHTDLQPKSTRLCNRLQTHRKPKKPCNFLSGVRDFFGFKFSIIFMGNYSSGGLRNECGCSAPDSPKTENSVHTPAVSA